MWVVKEYWKNVTEKKEVKLKAQNLNISLAYWEDGDMFVRIYRSINLLIF